MAKKKLTLATAKKAAGVGELIEKTIRLLILKVRLLKVKF
jgi:hypothetical protein